MKFTFWKLKIGKFCEKTAVFLFLQNTYQNLDCQMQTTEIRLLKSRPTKFRFQNLVRQNLVSWH
jgi:hypothetical protein